MESQEKKQQEKKPKQQQPAKKEVAAKKAFDPAAFPLPDYSAKRIEVWESAKAKRAAEAKRMRLCLQFQTQNTG